MTKAENKKIFAYKRFKLIQVKLFAAYITFCYVDCMTGKLNILKGSLVPVMHLLSQTTSRQLVTT